MDIGVSIPILPSRDLVETRAFYERLGFETGYWSLAQGYAILGRGGLRLHFFAHPELAPGDNYAGCYWRVADARALFLECQALGLPRHGIPRLVDIEDKPWGMREFALVDASGNLVRVGQELESADGGDTG
jgi:catechol 2,3-dioxygenase-like lactoylglutathione lyase family enzyme